MTGHERIEELFAADALDALDAPETEELSLALVEHGPDCTECEELRRRYREVAGRLSLALDPMPIREGFEEEVLAMARPPARWAGRRLAPRLVAAAAAIVLALVLGGVGGYLLGSGDRDLAREVAGILSRPGARLVSLQGEEGNLALAFIPSGAETYVIGSDLTRLPEDRVFELWTFRGEAPTSGGCFRADDGMLLARTSANVVGSDLVAVTIEPASCPDQPTSDPVFTGAVSD